MGGPVLDQMPEQNVQQQAVFEDIPERAVGIWDLVARWLEDLANEQVSGSILILIILVAFAGSIGRLLYTYIKYRYKHRGR